MRNCTNPKLNFQQRQQNYRETAEKDNDAICPKCGETAEWEDCPECGGLFLWDTDEKECVQCANDGGYYLCPFGCAD